MCSQQHEGGTSSTSIENIAGDSVSRTTAASAAVATTAAVKRQLIKQRLAEFRLKHQQRDREKELSVSAMLAISAQQQQELRERVAALEMKCMARVYGETLKDLVVLLHQKVWWQIFRSARQLATCPSEFFDYEFCCNRPYVNALRDAVGYVGMSMTDYGKLVLFFDNRDDMNTYFDPTKDPPVEMMQYIKDKATPDGDGWGHIRSIVLKNEKCFLGDPRDTELR